MNSIELMTKNEYEEWTASTRAARPEVEAEVR